MKRTRSKAAGVRGADVDPTVAARIDAAMRETEEILRADPARTIADPTLPIYRAAAVERLEDERKKFEQGDKMALLAAIRTCANHDLPLPRWASRAFVVAYDRVLNCKLGSWDDAFGRPYPKGSHLSALRKRRLYTMPVRMAVTRASESGRPIDETLFEEIGQQFGLGKTLTMELYYGRKQRKRQTSRLPRKTKK